VNGAPIALLLLALAPAVKEEDAQARTSLTDLQGRVLADGHYQQRVAGALLEVEARNAWPDGRTQVEKTSLRLWPQIEQQTWSWTETDASGRVLRSYEVDFRTGKAAAARGDERWRTDVDVERGKTFAGIGFMLAIKALRDQLPRGKSIELRAIAFTPRPRAASVRIIHDGPETVQTAGRSIRGDRFTLHPEIPAIARLFVHVPDQYLWLFAEGPPTFLRYEGPMVEPGDPVVRVDLAPGQR
jgi:hypothetical protein